MLTVLRIMELLRVLRQLRALGLNERIFVEE